MALPASFLPSCLSAFLPLTIACVDIAGAGAGKYVEREEKRFTVAGKPSVEVSTFDGSIEIRPWDRSEVLVVVEKRAWDKESAAAIDVQSEQNGNRVRVEVKTPRSDVWFFGFNRSRSARLLVSVPSASDVQARSGDGSIDVERITGAVNLGSGDGSIRGRELTGDLNVRTGDGSIRLEAVDGVLDANTGDGSIVVSGRLKGVRARSGDGSIAIHATAGSSAGDDWNISTGDGSVTLEIPDEFSAELDANTGDGRVRVEDVTLTNVTREIRKNSVHGRLGSGGHSVRVRTGDGSITLRRRQMAERPER